MMGLIVFTTLALRIHQPWMYAFAVLFSLATWVNVIYIGTHSAADVIVGWTGGLLVVLAYLTLEHCASPYFREGGRLDARCAWRHLRMLLYSSWGGFRADCLDARLT
jgi:hypothetical protein